MTLAGKYALVTGASRGVGRGIALQLGQAGATVYITGRSPSESYAAQADFALPSLEQTKRDIEDRGGTAIVIYCDHSDAADVKRLFEKIDSQTEGRLDILVNNAFSGTSEVSASIGVPFYEMDPSIWDAINNVGLRNHYYCSVYACKIMVKRNSGLIVNISSFGAITPVLNVAYGCQNVALDKMAADMAHDLKGTGVSTVSLWLAAVKTEASLAHLPSSTTPPLDGEPNGGQSDMYADMLANGESTEFSGKCVVALASDPKVSAKSGKILLTSDIARQYGFRDIDGKMPMDLRSLQTTLQFLGWSRLAAWIPVWIRIPLPLLHYAGYKFA